MDEWTDRTSASFIASQVGASLDAQAQVAIFDVSGGTLPNMPTSRSQEPGVFYKVSDQSLPNGTELREWQVDQREPWRTGFGAAWRAIERGPDHVATMLDADLLVRARLGDLAPNWPTFASFVVEVMFETERLQNFADRPRRWSSTHVFRTREAADLFNQRYRSGTGVIHHLLVQSGEPFHTFMDWTNEQISANAIENSLDRIGEPQVRTGGAIRLITQSSPKRLWSAW